MKTLVELAAEHITKTLVAEELRQHRVVVESDHNGNTKVTLIKPDGTSKSTMWGKDEYHYAIKHATKLAKKYGIKHEYK